MRSSRAPAVPARAGARGVEVGSLCSRLSAHVGFTALRRFKGAGLGQARGLVASTSTIASQIINVDGRDKPGHDARLKRTLSHPAPSSPHLVSGTYTSRNKLATEISSSTSGQ